MYGLLLCCKSTALTRDAAKQVLREELPNLLRIPAADKRGDTFLYCLVEALVAEAESIRQDVRHAAVATGRVSAALAAVPTSRPGLAKKRKCPDEPLASGEGKRAAAAGADSPPNPAKVRAGKRAAVAAAAAPALLLRNGRAAAGLGPAAAAGVAAAGTAGPAQPPANGRAARRASAAGSGAAAGATAERDPAAAVPHLAEAAPAAALAAAPANPPAQALVAAPALAPAVGLALIGGDAAALMALDTLILYIIGTISALAGISPADVGDYSSRAFGLAGRTREQLQEVVGNGMAEKAKVSCEELGLCLFLNLYWNSSMLFGGSKNVSADLGS